MTKKQTKQNADKRAVEATGTRLDNAGHGSKQKGGKRATEATEGNGKTSGACWYGTHYGTLDAEWFYTASEEEFQKGWKDFYDYTAIGSFPDAEHAEMKARKDAAIFDYGTYSTMENILSQFDAFRQKSIDNGEGAFNWLVMVIRRKYLILKLASALVGIAETASEAGRLAKKAIAEFVSLQNSGEQEAVRNALDMANEAAKAYFAEHLLDGADAANGKPKPKGKRGAPKKKLNLTDAAVKLSEVLIKHGQLEKPITGQTLKRWYDAQINNNKVFFWMDPQDPMPNYNRHIDFTNWLKRLDRYLAQFDQSKEKKPVIRMRLQDDFGAEHTGGETYNPNAEKNLRDDVADRPEAD